MKAKIMIVSIILGGFYFLFANPCMGDPSDKTIIRFGVITDLHHTNRPDTPTRKYSAALAKAGEFVKTIEREHGSFVIELGDFVDALAGQKDPQENLAEIEDIFTSFKGATYHVLGNHEFDNMTQNGFLSAVHNTNIPSGRSYYSWDVKGIHFVVLDAGYMSSEPHRPFDRVSQNESFRTWRDSFIPPQEVEWLRKDLKASNLPTLVFTHQTLDRVDDEDHTIKNASEIRQILEEDGQVIAVFSGHDHQGGYSKIKNIHYIVMNGNVGVDESRIWSITSDSAGMDVIADNQYAMVEVIKDKENNIKLKVKGYGRQPSYLLD